jgi:spoIIIJ-associated protein
VRDRIFSGANVEEALDAACRALDVSRDELTYIVIDEGSDTAVRRADKAARIAVFEDAGRPSAPRIAPHDPAARISEALRVLTHVSGVSLTASVSQDRDALEISLVCDDDDFLWGEEGEVFDSLCLLLRRVVARAGHGTIRVINQHIIERRRGRLERRAMEAAERARNERKPLALSGLSSFERRIVHLTLAGQEGIRTRSEGEDGERRLIIEPVFCET